MALASAEAGVQPGSVPISLRWRPACFFAHGDFDFLRPNLPALYFFCDRSMLSTIAICPE